MEKQKCKIEGCNEKEFKCGKCKKHYTDSRLTDKSLRRQNGRKV